MNRAWAVAAAGFLCTSPVGCARTVPRQTEWTKTLVVEKLRAAGLDPVEKDTVRHSFLSAKGIVYGVSGSDLQIFIYDDRAALEREVSQLDPVRVSPPTMMISWIAPPSLITSRNLVAILLARDDVLKETVKRALMGIPQ